MSLKRQRHQNQRTSAAEPDKQDAPQKKIPRPMNCFMAFRLEKQKEILENCRGANHRDISKVIAKWWKEMSDEEKAPYRERARLASAEHKKRYPNYKYQPQKRLLRPVRKYTRYKKDGAFTSRTKIYNTIMEHLYEHGPITEIDQLSLVGSPAPDSPAPTLYDSASSTASSPVCTPSTDPVSLQYPASPATCDTLLTPPLGYEVLVKAELLDHPVADTVYEAFIADLLRVEPHTGAMVDDIYSLLYPLNFEKPCIDPRMLDIKASDDAPETPTTEFVEESYILSHAV